MALKVLPASFAVDADRLERFKREAQMLAALNHPNIAAIYGFEDASHEQALVLELVDGSTLAELIAQSALGREQALTIARQLAEALEAAHEKGIIHRDLKPANIKIASTGVVKVLDFGLAKVWDGAPGAVLSGTSTVMSSHLGEPLILGTPAYMSPEQARGRSLDKRTDIWSFGCVLFEMFTGRSAFGGETISDTIARVLERDVDWSTLPASMPARIRDLLRRCLQKDSNRRLRDIGDARLEIDEILNAAPTRESVASTEPAAHGPSRGRLVRGAAARAGWLIAAGVTLVAAGAGAVVWFARPNEPAAPAPLRRLTSDTGLTTDPALSPDGKLVAYASDRSGGDNLDIWVQQVEGGSPLRLTSDPGDEYEPSFSPDGNRIVFRSERDGGGLYTIPSLGGEPRLIAKGGREPRFSSDGTRIAFVTGGGGLSGGARRGLFVMASLGGTPQPLVSDTVGAARPVWSPDGRFILFATGLYRPGDWGIVPSEPGSEASPIVVPLTEFKKKTGLADLIPYDWMPGNRILFVAKSGDSSHLFQIGIEPPSLTTTQWRLDSTAKRLTSGTEQDDRPSVASGEPGTGARRITFASMVRAEHLWSLDLDTDQPGRGGEIKQLTQESGFQIFPSISGDGTKLAFISHAAYNDEVWLLDLTTGKRLLLSNEVSPKLKPIIHADGSRVMWEDYRGRVNYGVSASGGAPQKLCDECGFPWDWSDDHARVLHYGFKSPFVVASMTNLETGNRSLFLESPGKNLYGFRWSPDRRWLSFHAENANEVGRARLYVAPFTGDQGPSETTWIPITDGSTSEEAPRWSVNGNWIYALSNRDTFDCIWAYPLDPRTKKPRGQPIAVFHSHGSRLSLRNANQISRDLAVGRDRVVFNQGEITGNIWMTEISQ